MATQQEILQYEGADLLVTFDYDKGFAGTYWEPPEPEEITITSVICDGQELYDICTEVEFNNILAMLWQKKHDAEAAYEDSKADAEYQRMKDDKLTGDWP